jgi:hypothetical protein
MKLLYYVLLVIIALVIIIVIAIKLNRNRKNNQTSRGSRSSSSDDSVRAHESDGQLLHNPAYLENPLGFLKKSHGQVDEEYAGLWGGWSKRSEGGKHKCKKRVKKPQKLKKSTGGLSYEL